MNVIDLSNGDNSKKRAIIDLTEDDENEEVVIQSTKAPKTTSISQNTSTTEKVISESALFDTNDDCAVCYNPLVDDGSKSCSNNVCKIKMCKSCVNKYCNKEMKADVKCPYCMKGVIHGSYTPRRSNFAGRLIVPPDTAAGLFAYLELYPHLPWDTALNNILRDSRVNRRTRPNSSRRRRTRARHANSNSRTYHQASSNSRSYHAN